MLTTTDPSGDVTCIIDTGLIPLSIDYDTTMNIYIEGKKGNYDLLIDGTTLTLTDEQGKVLWVYEIEGGK
ncbi:unnamed protein product [marine sediment metagenome]|uniref:Uncharacterized protein n=1 Tax=marine sediment metagenome TaxID=412755 RepID=X1E6C9_9ZZZZ